MTDQLASSDSKRRSLIESLAFLVVQQYRRKREQDENDNKAPNARNLN